MKIWVTGGNGMLGHYVTRACEEKHDVYSTGHGYVDISNARDVIDACRHFKPDAIINCAGLTSEKSEPIEMIRANSLGPHILASLGVRIVHMSTDCVYSGTHKGMALQSGTHLPDPTSLYGKSKLAGEVEADHVLNVRGSFIGKEKGFLKWLLEAEGRVEAWKHAYWNGTSVQHMARLLVHLAEWDGSGTMHVASPIMIDKATMVFFFADKLKLPIEIDYADSPEIYRVLVPDLETPPIDEVLDEMAEELCRELV